LARGVDKAEGEQGVRCWKGYSHESVSWQREDSRTMGTDLIAINEATENWFRSLSTIVEDKSPWIFLCLSTIVDYLSLATYTKTDKQYVRYPKFIEHYFPTTYKEFEYQSGKRDLPQQMYYILRCGLVHSFSLVPDYPATEKRVGRKRSTVLNHRSNAEGQRHLSRCSLPEAEAPDAARFVAEDFLHDTKEATTMLLGAAKNNRDLEKNILKQFTMHPPIIWKS